MTGVTTFYIAPSNPLTWFPERAALHGLQPAVGAMPLGRTMAQTFGNSRWGACAIPGDPQGRWLMDVDHTEDASELALAQLPGVVALPHVYSPDSVGDVVAGILAFAAVQPTDTMLQTLTKLRAAGIAGARPEPR